MIQKYVPYAIILATIIVMIVKWAIHGDAVYDDAYMFLRYAHNLNTYGLYGWNEGIPAYGCTSVAYVFLNALWLRMGVLEWLSPTQFLMAHASLYILLALGTFYVLVPQIIRQHKAYVPMITLGLMGSLLMHPALWLAVTGMDTMLSLWVNVSLIYVSFLYLNKPSIALGILMAVVAYSSFLVRPDNALYACLYPAIFLWAHRVSWQRWLLIMGVLASLFLVDAIVKYNYFGHLLPIPFVIKSGNFYEAYIGLDLWNAWYYLAFVLLCSSPVLLVIGTSQAWRKLRLALPFLMPMLGTWIVLLTKVHIMGFYGRLFIPSLPFLVGFALVGLEHSPAEWWQKSTNWLPQLGKSVVVLFIGMIGLSSIGMWDGHRKHERTYARAAELKPEILNPYAVVTTSPAEDFDMMMMIMDTMNLTGIRVAGSEHGGLAALNPDIRIVCLAGLHNEIAWAAGGFNDEVVSTSFRLERPDFIWMPHNHYVGLHHTILNNVYFQENYDYYHGYLTFGVAIRKDSPHKKPIETYLAQTYGQSTIIPTEYRFEASHRQE